MGFHKATADMVNSAEGCALPYLAVGAQNVVLERTTIEINGYLFMTTPLLVGQLPKMMDSLHFGYPIEDAIHVPVGARQPGIPLSLRPS